jgi:hypothetical protein
MQRSKVVFRQLCVDTTHSKHKVKDSSLSVFQDVALSSSLSSTGVTEIRSTRLGLDYSLS